MQGEGTYGVVELMLIALRVVLWVKVGLLR